MKKQNLLNIATLVAVCGLSHAASACENDMSSNQFSFSQMKMEMIKLPLQSRIIFNKDYKISTEDNKITSQCHIEPYYPTGGDITHRGSIFTVNDVFDNEGTVIVHGLSGAGNEILIHCEKEETLEMKSKTDAGLIGSVIDGLKGDNFQIDLLPPVVKSK